MTLAFVMFYFVLCHEFAYHGAYLRHGLRIFFEISACPSSKEEHSVALHDIEMKNNPELKIAQKISLSQLVHHFCSFQLSYQGRSYYRMYLFGLLWLTSELTIMV
jgi:hypothetical protein